MKPTTKQLQSKGNGHGDIKYRTFANRKKRDRAEKIKRAAVRVVQPVSTENKRFEPRSMQPVAKGKVVLGGALYLVAAIALHSTVVASLSIFGESTFQAKETKPQPTKIAFQITEPTPVKPPPAAPTSVKTPKEPEEKIVPPPTEKAKQRVKKTPQAVPQKRSQVDPVDIDTPSESQEPPRRRVVGISMESTTTGGDGPSMATGNTRMGQTDDIAANGKGVGKLKGQSYSPGSKFGNGTGSNTVATDIPTANVSFAKPKRLGNKQPPYPKILKAQGIEGNVLVLIQIDANGQVRGAKVIKSSGFSEFDNAAIAAAKNESYTPAKRGGSPVAYSLKYTYRFRLKGV